MRKLLLRFLIMSFVLLQAILGYCEDKRIMIWDNIAKKQITLAVGSTGQVLKSNGAGTVASFQNLDQSVNHKWNIAVTQPNAMYLAGSTIIPIGTAPANLTVTRVQCTTSSASYEVAGDLKYADARIGLANATVINDFDTTSGVRDDSTITSASVASSKFVYLSLDSLPSSYMTDFTVEVTWDFD